MIVCLYEVGVNLNRVCLSCAAFGVTRVEAYRMTAPALKSLRRAAQEYEVDVLDMGDAAPPAAGTLAMEAHYENPLHAVRWSCVERVVIGSERRGLPRDFLAEQRARIHLPRYGAALRRSDGVRLTGLTVEAALAITLYARAEALR